MRRILAEWIAKAEGDFVVMERESRVRKAPNYDAVCFHAQQCAEKYLKARLCMARLPIPKTHDLALLLNLVLPLEGKWGRFRSGLSFLTDFGVAYRYPGLTAKRPFGARAVKRCREFRFAARRALLPRTKAK